MKRIGLALGGGGAKGLAHVPLLQVLEEMNVRPACISGTSIGAIVGAIFASGVNASQLKERINRMVISKNDSLREMIQKKEAFQWIRFLDIDFRGKGIFKGDRLTDFLYEIIQKESFEELAIPLKIVATDFWASRQVIFHSGPLLSAVKASMGLPGLFTPVCRDGLTLIDGGAVNPLPHDILSDCEIIIAIDVMGRPSVEDPKHPPNPVRALLETFDIMQRSIIAEKRKQSPPHVYIAPEINGIDILDFHRAEEIYAQTESACLQLRNELSRIL